MLAIPTCTFFKFTYKLIPIQLAFDMGINPVAEKNATIMIIPILFSLPTVPTIILML